MRWLVRLLVIVLCTVSLSARAQVAYVWVEAYGPFVVLDAHTAALVSSTDWRSPAAFQHMVRRHPGLTLLVFANCPGTYDDASNLALGRLIRAARLEAYVPPGASVRSGAVDLLVAAERRRIDDGARFAVHAWRDWKGREPTDFAPNSPVHRKYLVYYSEMGMSDRQAAAFYAMTNSVPNRSARNMTAAEMRAWIGADDTAVPLIAYRIGP
jgi:hypothetical protein